MARETTQKKGAPASRKTVSRPAAKPAKAARPAPARKAAASRPPERKAAARTAPSRATARPAAGAASRPVKAAARPEPTPAAPPVSKKPSYYEALSMYESGVRALQRHDFEGAAAQFRTILERYPEERELQERSHLYLRVCERETARRPPVPQTPQERVYAATVALNAGDAATALEHLNRALADSPESDHAHYTMSVALASKGDTARALEHLRRAISLNPENRSMARQDPDLEPLRTADEFRTLVNQDGEPRARGRKKR